MRAVVNENEAALIWADEYSRMAEAYDKNIAPYFEPMARKVLEIADPKPGELFLDLATGTGLLACLLGPRVAPQSVVAIDLADGALPVASYRAGGMGLRNIRFEMMDIRNIVYRGKLFDGAACSFGIPAVGFRKVFQEVLRVLKPGGRFVFVEWADYFPEAATVIDELLSKHRTTTPSPRLREIRDAREFTRGHPDYKVSHDPDGIAEALRSVGFERVEARPEQHLAKFDPPERYLDLRRSYGEVDQELAEISADARAALLREASARLQWLARDGVLTVPWRTYYLRAVKP